MTFQEAFELSQKWHEHNLTVQATTMLIRDIEQRTKHDAVARIRKVCQLKCGDRESICECQRYINAVNGVFGDDAVQGGE